MTNIQMQNHVVKFLYDNIFESLLHLSKVKKELLQKKVGQRIIELRTKKGWTQSDLARACNKDRQALEKIENGKVNPTLYTLMEVAKALEVKISELVDF
ncbi:MAG TPA: helix-turn-helix transcriptional regulator [Cytophagaceae bacterium]|nr:helix-turn-helix transcriptional regulator [Cytophagaceae bacterium]